MINLAQHALRTSALYTKWLGFTSLTLCLVLLAPVTGCKSSSSNPLVGSWTLSADGTAPKVCAAAQQKVIFTSNTSQTWNGQGLTGGPLMVNYVVQLPNVFVSSAGGPVTYTVSGDSIIWYSPYGPCTYARS